MAKLESIDATGLDAAWPTAEPWIRAACERPGCEDTPEGMRAIVAANEGMLLLLMDGDELIAAAVLQVRDYRSGRRSLWVLAAGGTSARACRSVLTVLETSAAQEGCGTVEFVGRRGWAFLLPGYVATPCETGVHFSKSLRH